METKNKIGDWQWFCKRSYHGQDIRRKKIRLANRYRWVQLDTDWRKKPKWEPNRRKVREETQIYTPLRSTCIAEHNSIAHWNLFYCKKLYMHIHVRMYIYVCIVCVCVYICTHIYMYIYTDSREHLNVSYALTDIRHHVETVKTFQLHFWKDVNYQNDKNEKQWKRCLSEYLHFLTFILHTHAVLPRGELRKSIL